MEEQAIVISGENGDLGERFKEFTIDYTVTAEGEITVTETLGGTVLRSFSAVSGEAQRAVIPVAGLMLGQHTVTITATVGEESAERMYTFTVPAVWIDHGEAELGEKSDSFAIDYVPHTYSGEKITVTEYLDGEVQNSYTAQSGEAQSMRINMQNVIDGEHTLTITAESGENTAAVNLTFHTVAVMPQDCGTVQELQDEEGNPVFPVTLAKAVITSRGESVEKFTEEEVAAVSMENFVFEKITESCVWKVPKAYRQRFYVLAVGGGGGGSRADAWTYKGTDYAHGGGGGAGGVTATATLELAEGDEIEIICGAGGAISTTPNVVGEVGGDTIFGGLLVAAGGEVSSADSIHVGAGEDQIIRTEEYNTLFFMMLLSDMVKEGKTGGDIVVARRGGDGHDDQKTANYAFGGKGGDTLLASGAELSTTPARNIGGSGAGMFDAVAGVGGGNGGCCIIYFR